MAITKLMAHAQQVISAEEYEERRRIVENADTERLAENTEVENRLARAREEEVRTEQLSDDLDRADKEIETMESYVEHLSFCANNGGLDPKGMAMYNIAVEAIHERLGVPYSHRSYVSLEAFNGVSSRSTATLIAIEEESNKITEWLKAAWKWIVDLLKRIADTVTSLFSSKKAILNRVEALKGQLESLDDTGLSKVQWKSDSKDLNLLFFGCSSFIEGLENTASLVGSRKISGSLPSIAGGSKNIKEFLSESTKDLKTLSEKLNVGEGETVEDKFSDLEGNEKGKILAKLKTEFNKRGAGSKALVINKVSEPNLNSSNLEQRVWGAIEENTSMNIEVVRQNSSALKIQVSVNPKEAISTGKGCLPGYHAYIQTVVNSDTEGLFRKTSKDSGSEDVLNPNQFNAFFTSLMSNQEKEKEAPAIPLASKVNKTIIAKALDLCTDMVEQGDKTSAELKADMKQAESALDEVVSQIPSKSSNSTTSRVFRFMFSSTRALIKSLYNPLFKALTYSIRVAKGFLDALIQYINHVKSTKQSS